MTTRTLHRERLVTGTFNKRRELASEGYRIQVLRERAQESNDYFGNPDPGWKLHGIEIISISDDPDNHKWPEHNQMEVVTAIATETKVITV